MVDILLSAKHTREASTLIFKIRPCTVRPDLKNKAFSADFVLILKIRSYNARSDLKNKSACSSGGHTLQKYRDRTGTMGGVSRYFSKVSGSGVVLTLLIWGVDVGPLLPSPQRLMQY